ncbi:MAG: HAMP domain-containing histidine kinase, partial [Chloroflexi bacterium]|nr:HAMP domain-containing histidine kinase [Chloroflexota bacterium]
PPENQREYLIRAEQRAAAQLELIGDLLDLARLQNPDLCVEREPVDVVEALLETCDALKARAQEKHLEFTVSTPDERVLVSASPKHIRQLWMNLVSNAVKYTEEGSVSVTMTVRDGRVITTIRDTGIGIAPEDLPRVFEDFYRTKAAKACSQMGTGLGLSLVKRIVETHDGRLDVESAIGEGSTFTVTLPVITGSDPDGPLSHTPTG